MAGVLVQSSGPTTAPGPSSSIVPGSDLKCQFCNKHYSSASSLKTHVKWHTGDLKHKCSYCDKRFRNHSELRRHEMVHTGITILHIIDLKKHKVDIFLETEFSTPPPIIFCAKAWPGSQMPIPQGQPFFLCSIVSLGPHIEFVT